MSAETMQQSVKPEPKAALKVDLPWVLVQHVRDTARSRGVLVKDLVADAITKLIGNPKSVVVKNSRHQ